MASSTVIKTRSNRAASLKLPPGRVARTWHRVRRPDVVLRIGLCALLVVLLVLITRSWAPPLPYRSGHIPATDIVSRTDFAVTTERHLPHQYRAGDVLARHGRPLSTGDIQKLYTEHMAVREQEGAGQRLARAASSGGVYLLLLAICGWYLHVRQPAVWGNLRSVALLAGALLLAVGTALLAARDTWRAESIPLILFALTVAIAYDRALALVLSAAVALIVSLALGHSLPECLLLGASVVIPSLMRNRVRSRTRLIYSGAASGSIVFAVAVCIGAMAGQAFGAPHVTHVGLVDDPQLLSPAAFATRLAAGAAWYGLCVLLAGFLMTGLLPFLERVFDVHTEIRLLELGDAAHPLLQQLAQRAPGTYNHAINVASIGESAAEAIGANGLLVRVGAYFHDIGKMFKPEYFIENQALNGNQHDSLVPAMSTLVIFAHVKDGVNLARQHHLPRSIIDFIEQHHGTTLVEYFYRQAALRRSGGSDNGQPDESSFRYPGPKPQNRETAVLMMADSVEGACRTLTDPTPARIENLVREIAMKRLLDGQFEECGLTLRELHLIEESLAKSLTAVYHGRIKYPSQQTA